MNKLLKDKDSKFLLKYNFLVLTAILFTAGFYELFKDFTPDYVLVTRVGIILGIAVGLIILLVIHKLMSKFRRIHG